MYFDPVPKKKRMDLFDFEAEYNELEKALSGKERLIVIKGLRRTGKTSLMNVVYNELKQPKIFIDMREIMPLNQESFARYFYLSIMEIMSTVDPFKTILGKIKSIDVGIRIGIKNEENALSILLKNINQQLSKRKMNLIIFVDEAQLMKQISVDPIFAYIYDHLENVKVVFAGSEIGILDKMLKHEKNALFGRPYLEMQTKAISHEEAEKFLIAGFAQTGFKITKENMGRIIERMGGVIGWLALAGYSISNSKNLEIGLQSTIDTAKKITSAELDSFFENRMTAKKRYITILKMIAKQPLKWGEIKRGFEAKIGKISNNRFTDYLHTLQDYGYIIQKENKYYMIDNIVAEVVG